MAAESSAPSTSPKRLPLADLHRRLGARWMVLPEEVEVPADYGDPGVEYDALRHGCGLLDRSWLDHLELTGEDRQRFLNGLVTCDLKGLAAGGGAYGFFTTPQGRALADVVLRALEDRLWLELPAGRGSGVAEHVARYRVADRVECGAGDEMPLTLLGPAAGTVLRTVTGLEELPAPWEHRPCKIEGAAIRLSADGRWGLPAFTLWAPPATAETVLETLIAEANGDPPVRPVGYRAVDLLRVEQGIPWFGRDFGPDYLPQETGLEAQAVSYEKGCYLGQEVVARLHFRGRPSRIVCRLLFDGDQAPAAGTALRLDGREAATVTSAVRSPVDGRAVGLGTVRRQAAEAGTRLEGPDGLEAEVAPLPPGGND